MEKIFAVAAMSLTLITKCPMSKNFEPTPCVFEKHNYKIEIWNHQEICGIIVGIEESPIESYQILNYEFRY